MAHFIDDGIDVLHFFDAVQAGVVVFNKELKVVMVNEIASEIFEKSPDDLVGSATCCDLFRQEKMPCQDCLITDETKLWPKQKSVSFKNGIGEDVFLKAIFSSLGEYIVLTLNDVTKEVGMIRDTNFTRREHQAKTILLENKRRKVDKERHFFEQLLDHLPEALVTVDSSFVLQRKNIALSRIFHEKESHSCYELLGYKKPCIDCPGGDGFTMAEPMKKSHIVNDRYITEIISPSPFDDGGVLSFRDTTRQVELIGEIRDTQETLARQNNILSGLVELGTCMQHTHDLRSVVGFFLDLFLPVINSDAAAVLINDIRVGNLLLAEHFGMDDDQLNKLAKAYLDRNIQNLQSDKLPEDIIPWERSSQVVLVGGDGRRVGLIVLRGAYDTNSELIQLFVEPLGAYIHNRLLMRQLEEKAYTDSLTGLSNRAYVDKALKEEFEKFQKYNIHYAVVVGDVNQLKEVNDAYGHENGDRLLTTVATILKKEARTTDIVARIGGDEFLIILTNSNHESAQHFAKRLNEVVFRGITLNVSEQEEFPVTISLGAAGTNVVVPESLLKEADNSMYESKKSFYANHPFYRSRYLWATS